MGAREGPSLKSFPALWLVPSDFAAPAGGMEGLAGTVPRGVSGAQLLDTLPL